MELTNQFAVFGVGALGGLAAEALHWWQLRTSDRLPRYARSLQYWIITGVMVLLAGFVPWIQFGASAEGFVVFQIGIAAPILLQKLATAAPKPTGQMSGLSPHGSWRDFFTW